MPPASFASSSLPTTRSTRISDRRVVRGSISISQFIAGQVLDQGLARSLTTLFEETWSPTNLSITFTKLFDRSQYREPVWHNHGIRLSPLSDAVRKNSSKNGSLLINSQSNLTSVGQLTASLTSFIGALKEVHQPKLL